LKGFGADEGAEEEDEEVEEDVEVWRTFFFGGALVFLAEGGWGGMGSE